jgi:hypothetical protein
LALVWLLALVWPLAWAWLWPLPLALVWPFAEEMAMGAMISAGRGENSDERKPIEEVCHF